LGQDQLTAARVNWVCGEAPQAPFRAQVKIRYKADPAWGVVTPLGEERFQVVFERPLRDITPGQAAVVYDGEEVRGGGIIIAQSNLQQTR
ncbi:MAG: tRNA 2-thiouridine(34) synthase MnmA, partial [Chloroflexi bacterium]|nr:tRNA 2-thiouridine(34) synthase MnmA [Chloroflexota bacterium]